MNTKDKLAVILQGLYQAGNTGKFKRVIEFLPELSIHEETALVRHLEQQRLVFAQRVSGPRYLLRITVDGRLYCEANGLDS